MLIALCGLDILDLFLPRTGEVAGRLRWLLLIGPHWIVASLILAGVVWIERRGLSSIGFIRASRRDVGLAFEGFVVGVLAFGVTRPLVEALGLASTAEGIQTIGSLPIVITIGLALTVGITEEVLFRGYPIERLAELTGRLWVGAAVTFFGFTLAHVPFWGLGGALQIGAWTLDVTVL